MSNAQASHEQQIAELQTTMAEYQVRGTSVLPEEDMDPRPEMVNKTEAGSGSGSGSESSEIDPDAP